MMMGARRARVAPRALLAAIPAVALVLLWPAGAGAEDAFVVVRDGGFELDGEPFPVVGVNCYYLMVYATSASLRDEVDEVIDDAASLGATVVRTWAFNDGADQWNALQPQPGVWDEQVLVGLDRVVARAGELGLRLLLPLVNNWDDYGGMRQYVEWSESASTHDDFYTDADCRRWYRDHVRTILTRENTVTGRVYGEDPTIFGWELANEPRARQAGRAVLTAWIGEMSAYVKELGARQLVSSGSEGFWAGAEAGSNPAGWMASEGADFIASHAHATIDFASFHAYPDHWGDLTAGTMRLWVRAHVRDATERLGKPVLLGEFGKQRPVPTRDEYYDAIYDEILAGVEDGVSRAGALVWALYHDDYPDYDGFGLYVPDPVHESTASLLRESHARVVEALATRQAARFVRADANCDGAVDIADAQHTLGELFRAGPPSCCELAVDANADLEVDVSDAVFTLLHLFAGGPAPAAPYPACGAAQDGEPLEACGGSPACE